MKPGIKLWFALSFAVLGPAITACKDPSAVSIQQASGHASMLAETTARDVEEVRHGLPEGAKLLAEAFRSQPTLADELPAVRTALEDTRRRVQDLRVAKSTFFALADATGMVLRNDQEQDRMAGKALFAAYPALTGAKERYLETTGSLPEAAGVRAPRADAQWVAAAPVQVDGTTRALYVTGWSWASYAYRLEFALRSQIRTELAKDREKNEPLVYVFVLAGGAAYGAPVTPEVCASAVAELAPLTKMQGDAAFTARLELTGRVYGLAAVRAPSLGADVGVAVLRSET